MTSSANKPGRPPTKKGRKEVHVYIPAELDAALRKETAASERTRTAVVERALRAYLKA